jgi:hypothetical protein
MKINKLSGPLYESNCSVHYNLKELTLMQKLHKIMQKKYDREESCVATIWTMGGIIWTVSYTEETTVIHYHAAQNTLTLTPRSFQQLKHTQNQIMII